MLLFFALGSLHLALASPVILGNASADVFPPTATTVDRTQFPLESVVGFAGPTATGAEAFAYETAPAKKFVKSTNAFAPLVRPDVLDQTDAEFNPLKSWGNLGARYSLPAGTFGLAKSSPIAPTGCEITQVHLLFRHGSRYPSQSEGFAAWGAKLNAFASNGTFVPSGPLAFMNQWTMKLGYEILNTYGRQQCYTLGVAKRMAYGSLLNNFTATNTLPVFRTGSQDRMVETMEAFGQGFFGRNSEQQYSLELEIEATGYNATESPAGACNAGYIKDYTAAATMAAMFSQTAFNSTAIRIAEFVSGGYKIGVSDVLMMLGSCAYESISLGYSSFCGLFTEEDHRNYAYYYDILFFYGFGPGAFTGAAMGKGWVEELVARITRTPITAYDSSTNSTLDGNSISFPLNQSIYSDATHDAYVASILTALNFTAINKHGALPITGRPAQQSFFSSKLVPFNTNLDVQVMTCSNKATPQMRFILNDAVIPVANTYTGCDADADGLCAVSTVISGIKKRLAEIDFATACAGKWNRTLTPQDSNGLLPKQ